MARGQGRTARAIRTALLSNQDLNRLIDRSAKESARWKILKTAGEIERVNRTLNVAVTEAAQAAYDARMADNCFASAQKVGQVMRAAGFALEGYGRTGLQAPKADLRADMEEAFNAVASKCWLG